MKIRKYLKKEKELVENYHQLKALCSGNGKQFCVEKVDAENENEEWKKKNAEKAPNNNLFIINLFIYASKISFGFILFYHSNANGKSKAQQGESFKERTKNYYINILFVSFFSLLFFIHSIYMEKFL